MERAFKGIWIPKEIWLSKNLTLQEKVFLVEIDSLDNADGCFASNSYFADFFDLSNGRVSQVISTLEQKGYIEIEFEKQGHQIIKRIIKIKRPPYPIYETKEGYLENLRGYLENDDRGIKFSKEGYLENDKDNNISINNTNINNTNNNNTDILSLEQSEFENLWKIYKKKTSKDKSLKAYIKARNGYKSANIKYPPVSLEIIEQGLQRYNDYLERNNTQTQFIKDFSTWLNGRCWEDDYNEAPRQDRGFAF